MTIIFLISAVLLSAFVQGTVWVWCCPGCDAHVSQVGWISDSLAFGGFDHPHYICGHVHPLSKEYQY